VAILLSKPQAVPKAEPVLKDLDPVEELILWCNNNKVHQIFIDNGPGTIPVLDKPYTEHTIRKISFIRYNHNIMNTFIVVSAAVDDSSRELIVSRTDRMRVIKYDVFGARSAKCTSSNDIVQSSSGQQNDEVQKRARQVRKDRMV